MMTTMDGPVRVGLLGCGVVGGGTARILLDTATELEARAGIPIALARVAVTDLSKPRSVKLPEDRWTTDARSVVTDPTIHVVVEAMGGLEPARALILEAIANGKHVVTANKELLAQAGTEIMEAAHRQNVDVLFEASVGGGIPIVRGMKESLAGDRVTRLIGIVNGTTNFILTRMSESGESFSDALAEAQALGYAESDPTADVEGFDAASKLAILASLAFDARVLAGDVHREGISKITPADLQAAHDLGYEVKLLAVAESHEGMVSARVHPAMVPLTHPLAAVRDVFNAVFVEGEHCGELMFFGRGAGGGPSASAVVGDIVEIARNLKYGATGPVIRAFDTAARMMPAADVHTRYYLVLSVFDEPGVLSAIAGAFARHSVSIASVRQEGFGDQAILVLITHSATDGRHTATFDDLARLGVVKSVDSTIRVIGTAEG